MLFILRQMKKIFVIFPYRSFERIYTSPQGGNKKKKCRKRWFLWPIFDN